MSVLSLVSTLEVMTPLLELFRRGPALSAPSSEFRIDTLDTNIAIIQHHQKYWDQSLLDTRASICTGGILTVNLASANQGSLKG